MRRGLFEDHGLGHDERLAEAAVEPGGQVAREFDVLALVVADRNDLGVVQQDVGRHEHRIGEQADRGRLRSLLGRLVLELGHARGFAEAGDRVEDPGELCVGGNVGLHVERRLRRVDAGGDVLRGGAPRLLAKGMRILRNGDRVQVDDREERVVVALQVFPLEEGADVVADLERIGRRLHTRVEAGKVCHVNHFRGCSQMA